jgi:hypothetical protein
MSSMQAGRHPRSRQVATRRFGLSCGRFSPLLDGRDEDSEGDTHVDSCGDVLSDAGSTPAASTKFLRKSTNSGSISRRLHYFATGSFRSCFEQPDRRVRAPRDSSACTAASSSGPDDRPVPDGLCHGPFAPTACRTCPTSKESPSVMALSGTYGDRRRWETRRSTGCRTMHDRTAGWQTRPRRALYA